MSVIPDVYKLLCFDPGGTIGWAEFTIDGHAFSRPEHKVLDYVLGFEYGEYDKSEPENIATAVGQISSLCMGTMPYNDMLEFVSEDFILTQQIGGRNLLSPVRINAVLDWELACKGYKLNLQPRQVRTLVTKQWLIDHGLKNGRMRKDEFAAMQHAVTWLRRKKRESRARPWKLSAHGHHNAVYDCACAIGKPCDMRHPK